MPVCRQREDITGQNSVGGKKVEEKEKKGAINTCQVAFFHVFLEQVFNKGRGVI